MTKTKAEITSDIIEKLTDNYIAIAVITTCLYMAINQITTPEWLIMMIGFVIKYYFDKGMKNDNNNNNGNNKNNINKGDNNINKGGM